MGAVFAGLGAGAQSILGQRAVNEQAVMQGEDRAALAAQRANEAAKAQIELREAQLKQQQADQIKAAIDEIRKRNIMVNIGGQQVPLADVITTGINPKEFAPTSTPRLYPGMVGGKPHTFEVNAGDPNAIPRDLGERPPTAGGPDSATEKFLDTPIGNLTGRTMLGPGGTPFSNPLMTVRDAVGAGGSIFTDKNATEYANSLASEANLNTLEQAGKAVLPANVPTTKGETLRDITINPAERWLRAKVDPRYADYEHSKAGIITYMRDLARVGRINQTELNLIVDRLNNAQTYPALKGAVDTAKQILRQDRRNLAKGGSIDASGLNTKIEGPSGGEGWSAPITKYRNGQPIQMRHNGSTWQMLDPTKGWVPVQ